jgi:hypothetical protein
MIEATVPPAEGLIGLGTIVVVTRPGRPEIVMLTGELKLPIEVTVTVAFPHEPLFMISGLGDVVIVKSAVGVVTTNPTEMVCVMSGKDEPPVMVRL